MWRVVVERVREMMQAWQSEGGVDVRSVRARGVGQRTLEELGDTSDRGKENAKVNTLRVRVKVIDIYNLALPPQGRG